MTTATATRPHFQPTAEQAAARAQLRALARPHRYRVRVDGEGWPIIPGRLGQIEPHDGHQLAVYTDRRRMIPRLRALPGLRPRQVGDEEARFLFAPEAFPAVARLIGARRRHPHRPVTPELLARLAEVRPHKVTTPGQATLSRG
jgi:hypothetical protein